MEKTRIFQGSSYSAPTLTSVALQQSRAIMATSMAGGAAHITNWIADGNSIAED